MSQFDADCYVHENGYPPTIPHEPYRMTWWERLKLRIELWWATRGDA